jgi:hypothetical protein
VEAFPCTETKFSLYGKDKKIPFIYGNIHGKIIRENSPRYKNVTATYHRYKGVVSYYFLQCTGGSVMTRPHLRRSTVWLTHWRPGSPWPRALLSSGASRAKCCGSTILTINLVTDFEEAPVPVEPYTQLQASLLSAHQLIDYLSRLSSC